MTDAKSRYEIVESLTSQRQQIVDDISRLKEKKEQLNASLEQLKRNHVREVEETTRVHKQQIEDTSANTETQKKLADVRIGDLEKKEQALVEAIDALKSISANNEKA